MAGPEGEPKRLSSTIDVGLDFVILCLGRTGSTHLQSLLNSHPDVYCWGELFTPNDHSLDQVFVTSGENDPRAYVRGLTEAASERVLGFKMPLNSLRAYPRAEGLLRQPDLRFIRLSRSNLLALVTSRRLLAQTRVAQSTDGSYGDATVHHDPARLLRTFAKIDEHEAYLDQFTIDRPTYRLNYEELIGGEHNYALQSFLGLEPAELSSWFERVRARSLGETISNWDEVVATLEGTPFARYLDDDLAGSQALPTAGD